MLRLPDPREPDEGEVLKGCPSCGVTLPQMQRQAEMIAQLERVTRGLRARISSLTAEQNGDVKADPFYNDALIVWQHWREKISPKAREFSGKRLSAVLARLKGGYTPTDLCLSIDGYEAFPFSKGLDGKVGRSRTGREEDRYQDLEYICRDPEHVDKGLALQKRTTRYSTEVGLGGGRAWAAALCDCGHPFVEHLPNRLNQFGMSPCCHKDCDCMDFGDTYRRMEEWRVKKGLMPVDQLPAPGRDVRSDRIKQEDIQLAIDWQEGRL